MKKLLYISPFNVYPPKTGGSRYIYNYVNHLTESHNVYYFGTKDQIKFPNKRIVQFNFFPTGMRKYIDPQIYFAAFKEVRKIKPSEIIVAMPYQLFFGAIAAKLVGAKSIHHEQNVEFLRFKRIGKWWWPLMYTFEYFAYLLIDKVLYISETDKNNLIKYFHVPKKKLIYSPYIIDKTLFKPNAKAGLIVRKKHNLNHKHVVLFFGPLDYKPNKEALDAIVTSIAPKTYMANKNIKFLIVGKNPPNDIKSENMIFTGFVDRIEDYINACDLVIVPLQSGGGIRTKILESLACGKKVISTAIGAEGIDEKDFPTRLFIAKDLKEMSNLIINKL